MGVETHGLGSVLIFGIALLSMGFYITFKMVLIAFMLRYTKSIDTRAIPISKHFPIHEFQLPSNFQTIWTSLSMVLNNFFMKLIDL